jgi:hypothetical protein
MLLLYLLQLLIPVLPERLQHAVHAVNSAASSRAGSSSTGRCCGTVASCCRALYGWLQLQHFHRLISVISSI